MIDGYIVSGNTHFFYSPFISNNATKSCIADMFILLYSYIITKAQRVVNDKA